MVGNHSIEIDVSDDRTCMILEEAIDACQLLTCQVIVLIWPVVGETALGLQDLSGCLESGQLASLLSPRIMSIFSEEIMRRWLLLLTK